MSALLAAGDVAGARIANETLSKLLGNNATETRDVVDLDAERRKRKR